MITEKGTITRR